MAPLPPVPQAPPPWPGAAPARRGDRWLGLFLVAPAALAGLVCLVVPTVQTIWQSFRRGGLVRRSEFVGTDNYTALLESSEFWEALVFSLTLAVLPLIVAIGVAPLLAGALDSAGTWPRRAGRVLMSVPLVVFSPVAIAVAWLQGQRDDGFATVFGRFGDPDTAPLTVMLIIGAATFGAVCGLALLVFLAVLRGRTLERPVLLPALAVGMIAVLAAFAVSLQAFSIVYTMTRGGPAKSTQTLSILQFTRTFQLFDLGRGAAVATMIGLLLAALGVLATLIVITFGLRIELVAADRTFMGPARTLIAALVLAAVLAVAVAGSWPWLAALFSSSDAPRSTADAGTYVNTWVPPLLSALVSVGTAYLAALGIGGLRPLGRHSEWLLLPFAPWLFVGAGPVSVAGFDNAENFDLIGTFAGLIPPFLLSVPALVVLTLFCRGQSERWRAMLAAGAPAGPAFLRAVAGPALPLAAFLGGALVMIGSQDLFWPLLIGSERDVWTAPVALTSDLGRSGFLEADVSITTPIAMVVLALAALIALQIAYLDRLAITASAGPQPKQRLSPPVPPPEK